MKKSPVVKLIRWAAIAAIALLVIFVVIRRDRTRSTQAATPPTASTPSSRAAAEAGDNAKADQDERWKTWKDRISSYTAQDYQTLTEAAMGLPDSTARQTLLAEILAAWLKFDARSFNKYFMALEVSNELTKLELLASSLKPALAELADRIPTSDTLKEIVRRMIAHLARANPHDALQWATRWLRGDTHDTALVQILRPLTERDPQRALRELSNISSPLRHMQALAAIGGTWAKEESAAAADWAAKITAPTDRAMAMNAVLLAVAQNNPAEAAHLLADAESIMLEEYLLKYRDTLAALNITEADLANDPETYRELRNSGTVPPLNSPDVELMAEAARVIASKLASGEANAGAEWAESLESEYLRLTAMKGALAGWSRSEPEGAIDYFAANYAEYGEILGSLFGTWAAADPSAAATGISLLQSPAHRTIATDTVAKTWATVDPASTARWMDQLPEAQLTDQARLALATALSSTNPTEAWNRALEILDPSLQYKALKTTLSELVSVNPEAARTLLASTNLPPNNLERLTELLRATQ